MFTGIIAAKGKVSERLQQQQDLRLRIHTGALDLADVSVGDSIAVNGVCLTSVALTGDGFWADVSGETESRTTLGALHTGDPVNLEKAPPPSPRPGGHLVSGHVDGIGTVTGREAAGESVRFRIRVPRPLARYIAEKGSVCVDGISLTINAVHGDGFEVNIVPHTLQVTTLGTLQAGARVNIEVDIIARYLERLLLGDAAADAKDSGITAEFLAEHGFLK